MSDKPSLVSASQEALRLLERLGYWTPTIRDSEQWQQTVANLRTALADAPGDDVPEQQTRMF